MGSQPRLFLYMGVDKKSKVWINPSIVTRSIQLKCLHYNCILLLYDVVIKSQLGSTPPNKALVD
jgi:hypothetical protein